MFVLSSDKVLFYSLKFVFIIRLIFVFIIRLMSTMEADRVSEDMASFNLGGEEDKEFVFTEGEVGEEIGDASLCVVGRFLIERPVNFTVMKHTLATLMKPVMGMSVKEINGRVYVF